MIWILVGILLLAVAFLFYLVGVLQDAVLTLQNAVKSLYDTMNILQTNHTVLNDKIIPKLEKLDELTK